LQTSLKDVAAVFDKTSPIFQSGAKMVGEDFTKMVLTTRDALTALKGTAKTIDDTLRFISTIPLIGTPYNPSVPLDVSIGDLSQSMDQLPSRLAEIKGWLEQTGGDFLTIKKDTLSMADKMGAISPMIKSAKTVTSQYQVLLKNLTQKLNDLESGLPRALLIGSICLTIFLVWLTLAQIGPFVQGLERFRQ
jgi:methyl-accepting chemotaxis protein